jgi:hypothetical protein
MPKMRKSLTALTFLVLTAYAEAAPTIEPLQKSEEKYVCGCSFQFPSSSGVGKTFLQWPEDEDALMRVDGKPQQLSVKQIGAKYQKAGEMHLGDSEMYLLKNDSVQVKMQCFVSFLCNPNDSQCEFVGYRAKVSVKSANGVRTLNAMGACGC